MLAKLGQSGSGSSTGPPASTQHVFPERGGALIPSEHRVAVWDRPIQSLPVTQKHLLMWTTQVISTASICS